MAAIDFELLRGQLPAKVYRRSYAWALGLAALVLALYAGLTVMVYMAPSLWWLLLWSVARGLSIGPVFIVAHDACHDSLSPSSRLNRWLGQACFLPSWHSFTAWKARHNHAHHRHTNILELDPGYAPASRRTHASWPRWKRLHYLMARTPLGAGLLYIPELLRYQLFPEARTVEKYRAVDRAVDLERVLVWAWMSIEVLLLSGLLAKLGVMSAPALPGWLVLACGFLLAHLVWNWQMGFTTFLHHFHPKVAWYSIADAPGAAARQLRSTTHVDLGRIGHLAMLNIFVHTAHHVDTRIPLYRLPGAQVVLQQQHPVAVRRWKFSPRRVLECFRTCKFWNVEQGRWER